MGSFVRRVKTASGATAVQIVHKRGRDVVGIDHIGSAHDDAALALLLHAARERRHAGQQALELNLDTAPAPDQSGRPVVEATVWVPETLRALCDVLILVDQSAQPVGSSDVVNRRAAPTGIGLRVLGG